MWLHLFGLLRVARGVKGSRPPRHHLGHSVRREPCLLTRATGEAISGLGCKRSRCCSPGDAQLLALYVLGLDR